MPGQDPGAAPAPGSRRGSDSRPRSALSIVYPKTVSGTGLSHAEGGKEGNQLPSCCGKGPQRGRDRWKRSLVFPGQDVKCWSIG